MILIHYVHFVVYIQKRFFIYFGVVLTQPIFGQTSAHLLEIISCPAFNFVLKMFYLFFFTYDISFHKEYYLINLLLLLARFSIHKCKYGNYKPLFLILKSEVKQYLKSIYTLINKKAVKCINICKHFHVFM